MNTTKQFWTLFKFQVLSNPALFFMVIAFALPLFMRSFITFDMLLWNQNLFLVAFLGLSVLSPETLISLSSQKSLPAGAEFFLTRAVDRRIVARARASCFYLFVLAGPILALLYSLSRPTLQVTIYSRETLDQCLSHIAGSSILKDSYGHSFLVSIPDGNGLIGSWSCWEFLAFGLGIQLLISLISTFKYRIYVLGAASALIIGLPFFSLHSDFQKTSFTERVFFLFAEHHILVWAGTIIVFLLVQLEYERRFTRQEH